VANILQRDVANTILCDEVVTDDFVRKLLLSSMVGEKIRKFGHQLATFMAPIPFYSYEKINFT